jgi:Domain of unknown function (DUF4189)
MIKTFKMAFLAIALAFVPASAFAWGAIAVDDKAGQSAEDAGYGFVTGEKNEAAASRGAMKECRAQNKACKVVITFETCGAYASSGRRWGAGEGVTEGAARRKSLVNCGNEACKVVVAECN